MKRGTSKLLIIPTAVAFGVIFALIITELGMAVFWPQKTFKKLSEGANRCWLPDAQMFVRPKPDCSYLLNTAEFKEEMKTNSLGFRGPEVQLPKDPNVTRIVVTGDSFVFGFGVAEQQTFVRQLEKYIKEAKIFGEKNVEVINAGFMGGFSPDGHLINLRAMVKEKYEPDFIIMSTFVFNDFSDMDEIIWTGSDKFSSPDKISSKNFVVTKEGLLQNKNAEYKGIYQNPLLRNLNTAIFLSINAPPVWDKIKIKFFGWKPYISPDNAASDNNFFGIQFQDCIFGDNCHRRFLHLFSDMVSVFRSGQDQIGQISKLEPNFLVLIIPADFQIYEDAAPKYGAASKGISQGSKIQDPNPQKRLKQMLDEQGIAYLDLLPVLRKNSEPRKYFPIDGHWNAAGSQLAAETLAAWFRDNF